MLKVAFLNEENAQELVHNGNMNYISRFELLAQISPLGMTFRISILSSLSLLRLWNILKNLCIYIYRKSASLFSRRTVLNTLKQSRINIMRGKKGRNYISRQACFVNRFTLQGFKYIYIYTHFFFLFEELLSPLSGVKYKISQMPLYQ